MIRSRIKRINSTVFLLLVFSVGALSLRAVDIPNSALAAFFKGETFRRMETHYQQAFPRKNWLIGLWAALQYTIFREGRPGVVVGSEDWLFTAEEFRLSTDYREQWRHNIERIVESAEMLSGEGIRVVVALLPEKADIYRRYVRRPSPHTALGLYDKTVRQLRQKGIVVIDLRRVLEMARDEGEQVFLRTDTHWTVRGAEVAAAAVAGSELLEKGSEHYTAKAAETVPHIGDLASFIPTGEAFAAYGPAADTREVVKIDKEGDSDLFAEVEISTALVGTSYSADERWRFADWLQLGLGQEIVNYAEMGHGPFQPMDTFLKDLQKNGSAIDQVLWEIPIRYLVGTGRES